MEVFLHPEDSDEILENEDHDKSKMMEMGQLICSDDTSSKYFHGANIFTEDKSRTESTPDIIHIIESGSINSLMYHLHGTFYAPLSRCNVFYPHWLQDVMDRDLRFYLHPITKESELLHDCSEGHRLLKRVRYLIGKFSWNSLRPICLQMQLAENQGNKRLPRRHRLKPLLVKSLFVDHTTNSAVFQGKKFSFAIGVPFPGDLEDNTDDLGAKIDIGIYVRELDSHPGVKIRWYVSLCRCDLPNSAIDSAENQNAMSVMDLEI